RDFANSSRSDAATDVLHARIFPRDQHSRTGDRDLFPNRTNPGICEAQIRAAQTGTGLASATQESTLSLKTGPVRAGVARLAAHGLALDARWCYHPQLADVIALARAVPQPTIVMCHVGGVLGYGAYAGKKDEVHAAWRGRSPRRVASQHGGVGHVPERLRQ